MKYKDYYAVLGLERGASDEDIKKAYRRHARKYHPDVSKEKDAEAKFKDVAEAWTTLKDPAKRAAYDQLGQHRPGEDFRPPPDWETRFSPGSGGGTGGGMGDGIDLSDLFEFFGAQGRGRPGGGSGRGPGHAGGFAFPGQDFEVQAQVSLEDMIAARELTLNLELPEPGPDGRVTRVRRAIRVRVPRGATDGERLRVPGKGGAGIGGAPAGDLYITLRLLPHPLYRVTGHDIYLDLPLTPSEAVLGAQVQVPTPGGPVALTIKPGARAGQKLRLPGRGMPLPGGDTAAGDQYCVLSVTTPTHPDESELALYRQLAEATRFNPREHFK